VRGLVVISAGFAEIGDEGAERQARLLETCRSYGMRLIGPNCMGIVNTAEDVRLNGTFASVYPPAGRVGFTSQSGALGLAVMQYATELELGLSSFVSVGNKADISGNDLIAYWSGTVFRRGDRRRPREDRGAAAEEAACRTRWLNNYRLTGSGRGAPG
jgi:acetate---CoA ligase (ADP-forming)